MPRPASSWRVVLVCLLVATTGCSPTQPFYLHEDGDLSHYIDTAIHAESPDLLAPPISEVGGSLRPLSVNHPEFKEFWDLTLEECVAIALLNTKNIRGGTAASPTCGRASRRPWPSSIRSSASPAIHKAAFPAARIVRRTCATSPRSFRPSPTRTKAAWTWCSPSGPPRAPCTL